jgi:hypothetical protein
MKVNFFDVVTYVTDAIRKTIVKKSLILRCLYGLFTAFGIDQDIDHLLCDRPPLL